MRNICRLFVSCHRNDRDFVARLVRDISNRLPESVVSYYMNIGSGSSLAESLLQEIERADTILAVFSPDFASSSWAQQELNAALNRNLKDNVAFIPLRLHPCSPNDNLSQFAWIDFTENYEAALAKLIGEITGEASQMAQADRTNRGARTDESPFTPPQLKRRQALLAQHDKAIEHWPQRIGSDFSREMHAVVDGLVSFAQEADAAGNNRLERARTWRYAALALLDLGASGDIGHIESAQTALGKAESLLNGIDDAVERIKLHANYAQVLRHLSRARVDVALIREARQHLIAALELARTAQPDAVQPLQDALANTESVLPMAEEVETLERQIKGLTTEIDGSQQAVRPPYGAAEAKTLFGMLKEQVEKESGSLDSATGEGLNDFMARLGGWVEAYGNVRTFEDSLASRAKLGALMAEFQASAKKPSLSGPDPLPGPRGEKVLAWLQELKMFVITVTTDASAAAGTREAAMGLLPRIARLTTRLSEAGDDEKTFRLLEIREARGLAHEVRSLARQRHVTLAQPVWARRNLSVDVNRIFFSGPSQTQHRLNAVASALDLELNHPAPTGADFAESRWHGLRTANLAVFDLSEDDPQVYYELGIALALGTELLLIAKKGMQLPFNVAQNVRFYTTSDEQRQGFLEEELDAALYGLQVQSGNGSSLSATLDYAERLAAIEEGNAQARVGLQSLRNAGSDPVKFFAALEVFIRFLSVSAHDILLPRWPSVYPDPQSPHCFVIMPFRADLDHIYRLVASTAEQAGVKPVRGDIALGQQIIESIWEEICRATHVVVDLTGLNLNVCLELGIAHTLGKPTWLIGREETERMLQEKLPGIGKRRCHTYPEGPTPKQEFMFGLTTFLGNGRLPSSRLPDLAAVTSPDLVKRAQARSEAIGMILNDPALSIQEKGDSLKSLLETFKNLDSI